MRIHLCLLAANALAANALAAAPSNAQAPAAPVEPAPVARPQTPAEAAETAHKAQLEQEAMAAREEEALSRPASWGQMSLDELEKSIGGRTLVEVKAKGVTIEEVAALLRAQSGLDIFTHSQLIPQPDSLFPAERPPTYSFDISRRPLWEAMRALSIAHAEQQKSRSRGFGEGANVSSRMVFHDMGSLGNTVFSTPLPSSEPSLALLPVNLVRATAPPQAEAQLSDAASPPQNRTMLQVYAPNAQLLPASPRAGGVRWQLGPALPEGDANLARGRSFASWPCFFEVDYITRKQDNFLGPDSPQALPRAAPKDQPKTAEEAKASQPARSAEFTGATSPEAVAALDEWQQSVALQMRAYVDPRLRQYRNVRLVVDEATDEAGHDLRREEFTHPRRVRLDERADLDLPIALRLPRERGAKGLKLHLRGALLFWVPARVSTQEFALGEDGTATRQTILWGQAADHTLKLSRNADKSWLLSSAMSLSGDHGQLDFRREMGPALKDDNGYRAGLTLPGSIRIQSEGGCEWTLRPWSEEQLLTLNAGVNLLSYKTQYVGAFRRARTPDSTFDGSVGPTAGYYVIREPGREVQVTESQYSVPNQKAIPVAPVPPDGYAYAENVTWQLQPANADGGACGTGDEPPAITKIFFDAPQEWREVRVPFEFRDLPLPPR